MNRLLSYVFPILVFICLSLSPSVATAITGLPLNITTFFQNVSCIGNESFPESCPYLDATNPLCNDISANHTAGVRCTRSELLVSRYIANCKDLRMGVNYNVMFCQL